MKLLADENMDTAIVIWLRQQGHDVLYAAEDFPEENDSFLLCQANASSRVLLIRDLDFGDLVFRQRLISAGVILLRFKARNQRERLSLFQGWWPEIEPNAAGHFITLRNDRVRIRPLPALIE